MSNLGQKIKEALTGQHGQDKADVKTPDVNVPGAYPSDEPSTNRHSDHTKLTKGLPRQSHHEGPDGIEVGLQHHTGHSRHDPELETKQATSDAGNYPYWGNLPREGGEHLHRSEGPSINALKQQYDVAKDSSLATGTSAAGITTGGAGYIGDKKLGNQEKDTIADKTQTAARRDSKFEHEEGNTKKDVAATGIAGTTYLSTRDKADTDRTEKKSDSPAPLGTSKATQLTQTSNATENTVETATSSKMNSSGDNNSHRKEEEALAASAGAAGLAGAGYYASQREDRSYDSMHDAGSRSAQGINARASEHAATCNRDPVTETQKEISGARNSPSWKNEDSGDGLAKNTGVTEAATPSTTTSSGDNGHHQNEQTITAGAGGSGFSGAGYLASRKLDDHEEGKQLLPTRGRTHASTIHHDAYPNNEKKDNNKLSSPGLAAAGIGGAGLVGAEYLASHRKDENKDERPDNTRETSSGIAAPGSLVQRDITSRQADPTTSGGIHNTVVGAGSSEYSHPVGSSNTLGSNYDTQSSSQMSQAAAQAAAKQAWNKQQPTSSNTMGDSTKESKNTDLKHAAAGAAFGVGATGLAADYGQGRDHENNPRSDKSEEIADRALGSDGKAHAPSASDGKDDGNKKNTTSGLTSGISGLAEKHGVSGNGSKVLHKCDRCGYDNDISRYFDEDAVFRSQQ